MPHFLKGGKRTFVKTRQEQGHCGLAAASWTVLASPALNFSFGPTSWSFSYLASPSETTLSLLAFKSIKAKLAFYTNTVQLERFTRGKLRDPEQSSRAILNFGAKFIWGIWVPACSSVVKEATRPNNARPCDSQSLKCVLDKAKPAYYRIHVK